MDVLGLADKARTRFGKLSGGQKQRLSIALALVGNPRVAVLDELTTGLDPQARRDTWELIEGVRDRGVTIVLVTHFMEEAERLCDRVALIDAGRVVALDTPAALAERVETEQRIQFRPSVPLDDGLLDSLPDVTSVIHRGDVVVVTGTSNALNAVTSVLARNQIVARQLRVEQASLEDAFLALTGRHSGTDEDQEAERWSRGRCQPRPRRQPPPALRADAAHHHRAQAVHRGERVGLVAGRRVPAAAADHLRQHPLLQARRQKSSAASPRSTSTCRS